MNARGIIVAVVAALVLGSGCGTVKHETVPTCETEGNNGTLLAAQTVPTANLVPCIAGYPAGWRLVTVELRSGLTSFTLGHDRGGDHALKVTLRKTCDVSTATEVPTDEPGTRRFEKVLSVDGGYRGDRFYIFPGGCVTYQLRFNEPGQTLVNEASLIVGFQTRKHIADEVERQSDGRLHL